MPITNIRQRREQIKSLISNSLVGKSVQVIDHSDHTLHNMSGVVIEDTSNTLRIENSGEVVRVTKNTATFQFSLEDMVLRIDGELIIGSLKRRRKRKLRNW